MWGYQSTEKKLQSPKCTFDTAVFFEKYSSLINWGLDELPETISKEKLKEKEFIGFHNPIIHVFTRDSIYYIPLSFEYEFQHKKLESKVNELFVMMFRLTEGNDERTEFLN